MLTITLTELRNNDHEWSLMDFRTSRIAHPQWNDTPVAHQILSQCKINNRFHRFSTFGKFRIRCYGKAFQGFRTLGDVQENFCTFFQTLDEFPIWSSDFLKIVWYIKWSLIFYQSDRNPRMVMLVFGHVWNQRQSRRILSKYKKT